MWARHIDIPQIDFGHVESVDVFDWYRVWMLETMASRTAARRARAMALLEGAIARWKVARDGAPELEVVTHWQALRQHGELVRTECIRRWVARVRDKQVARSAARKWAQVAAHQKATRASAVRAWMERHARMRSETLAISSAPVIDQLAYSLRLRRVRFQALARWAAAWRESRRKAAGTGRPLVDVIGQYTQHYGMASYVETDLPGALDWQCSTNAEPGEYLLLAQRCAFKPTSWTLCAVWAPDEVPDMVEEYAVRQVVRKLAPDTDEWV